jgi:hypothetical protein
VVRLAGAEADEASAGKCLLVIAQAAKYRWHVRAVKPVLDAAGRLQVDVQYHDGLANRNLAAELRAQLNGRTRQ